MKLQVNGSPEDPRDRIGHVVFLNGEWKNAWYSWKQHHGVPCVRTGPFALVYSGDGVKQALLPTWMRVT